MQHGQRFMLVGLVAAAVAGLLGCAPSDADDPTIEDASEEETVRGRLLHRHRDDDGRTVEFYDLGDGDFGVRERTPLGVAQISDQVGPQQWSLAEVYRRLRPGLEVPTTLREADARLATRQIALLPAADVTVVDGDLGIASLDEPSLGTPRVLAECSSDVPNGDFGAQWFMDKFCKGGNDRWCLTNRSNGYAKRTASWLRWSVMAADFRVGARSRGYREGRVCHSEPNISAPPSPPPDPLAPPFRTVCETKMILEYDEKVAPREVLTWTVSGDSKLTEVHANGDDACRRVHYANAWNR